MTKAKPHKKAAKGKAKRLPKTKARPRQSISRKVRRPASRSASRSAASRSATAAIKNRAKSAATMAARVFANRKASTELKRVQPAPAPRPAVKAVPAAASAPRASGRKSKPVRPSRPPATAYNLSRQLLRMSRAPQFTYMKAPGADSGFDVGDTVEVFCDHERDSERVRGWVKGVVVQVDNKLVAVQFRSNVFLTDGWMVPDRILWYSLTSDQIRNATLAKKGSHRIIPDY